MAYHLKAKKDIEQAAQLLSVLLEDRPGDILFAWEAAQSRPDKFSRLLQKGIQQLPKDLQKRLQAEIQRVCFGNELRCFPKPLST